MKNRAFNRIVRSGTMVLLLVGLMSCATPQPVPVWYALSPPASQNFPQGDLNSPPTTWEQLQQFPDLHECQNAMAGLRAQIHRPVECISSDDHRLTMPQRKPGV